MATHGPRRLLLAGLVGLAAGLGGELAALPALVHLLCLAGVVVGLAVVAYVVPRLAVDEPTEVEPGRGV